MSQVQLSSPQPPRAAYVHVPFCKHRCGYCNFTLVAGRDDLIDAYLEALAVELSWLGEPRPVDTLFFGGGTPSHLPLAALERLLTTVARWFVPAAGCEWSVEINPGDMTEDKAALLAGQGVTRISVGAQSFNPPKLAMLERWHDSRHIADSVELARRHVRSVSLDLIFATPGETLDAWHRDLAEAIGLRPDHVSTYGLTYEKGTTYWSRLQQGALARADEELERRMYLAAIDALRSAGFEHYEVSNFARAGHRCRHNETYWRGDGWYAVGPGAARYVAGRRETNHRSTTTWIRRVLAGQSPVAEGEWLEPQQRARELLVLGLRRIEGIERPAFQERTGFSVEELLGPTLERCVEQGLLEHRGEQIRLTREGLLVSDAIWPHVLLPE